MEHSKRPRVLVVGGGGRETALVWKLSQSPRRPELYCCPGNYSTAILGTNINLKATDLDGIVKFAKTENLDLVVVAPDDPLALGLVDRLDEEGIRAFGPTAAAAKIEGSKAYAKELMASCQIPTARSQMFEDEQTALTWLSEQPEGPLVVKADGLALGKGVIICDSKEDAIKAIHNMMHDRCFGEAGRKVLIEEFLVGQEITVLAFTDGKTIRIMPSSKDHKRALDCDKGLNTGGMGAISPALNISAETWQEMDELIFQPTLTKLREMGTPFKGVIYFGLMLTNDGPKVIEYNARFGDPECQCLMPLLETDLLDICDAVIDETLADCEIRWHTDQSTCVLVAASGGYPESYKTGLEITGLSGESDLLGESPWVFGAGVQAGDKGIPVTSGGRVLNVVALADTLETARNSAYDRISEISFDRMHYRKDIGDKCE
ncbi:MAG: phosphoribosylamine--glycine ligase [Fastidiosipilaceae bacterium]|nr:phosphoribosylamine--glycine ligase [Clostridiaceae bacterium]